MTCPKHPDATWFECPDCGGQKIVDVPVFKRAYPAPMRVEERDIDLMGEAELRILVKKLLAERT